MFRKTFTAKRLSNVVHPQIARRPQRALSTQSSLPPLRDYKQLPETFSAPSKPEQYYDRPLRKDDLPKLTPYWPTVVSLGVLAASAWGVFLLYATNQEKLSSSVVRQILATVRASGDLKELLGDRIHPQPEWYLNGSPWIAGSINQLQGNVDVSFRVKGSKSSGTLYFTSVRKAKGAPFTILRFKVICDDGTVVQVKAPEVSKLAIAEQLLPEGGVASPV